MKNKVPYQYSEGDLRRYHDGSMPEGERHLLERAALEDPFLADALEGYALQPGAAADLPQLKEAIQGRGRKNPRLWLPLSAAAVLLLTALALWWWLPETAEQPTALSKERTEQSSEGDTITNTIEAQPELVQADALPEQPVARNRPAARRRTVASAPADPTPDLLGPASLTPDSATPDISTASAVPQAALKRGDSLGTIVLQPMKTELQEVIIASGTGSRKASMLPLTASAFPIDSLEPTTGWTDFEHYVAERLMDGNPVVKDQQKGLVRLSFDTDAKGQAINIRVETSDCTGCEEAAIRILKEGPKWKKKSRNRARIGIRF